MHTHHGIIFDALNICYTAMMNLFIKCLYTPVAPQLPSHSSPLKRTKKKTLLQRESKREEQVAPPSHTQKKSPHISLPEVPTWMVIKKYYSTLITLFQFSTVGFT